MHRDGICRALFSNVDGLRPSATVAINDRSNQMRRAGKQIFKLGLGQSPFPVPRPVVQALRRAAAEKDYLPVQGLLELQEAVADHHARTFGIACRPEDVLIGPGSKELMFLLQLVYDGELVLPTPSWVSYAPQARSIGRTICPLPTAAEDRWLLAPRHLDGLCDRDHDKPRLLILNYPSNPAGTTLSDSELAELAETARQRGMLVLSDEIYGKVHHAGRHRSIVPHLPEQTIFSGGLSKWCGAGGWRLGLFVFPPGLAWLRKAMSAVATETFTSTSAPIQRAAVAAFRPNSEIDEYLSYSRRILCTLGRTLASVLRASGAGVVEPEGGFYLFPDFSPLRSELRARGIENSRDLCERLLADTGVAILPGSEFGRPETELTARIAYVDFDGAAALEACAETAPGGLPESFVENNCRAVLEGVRRLCAWLHG